MASVIRGSDLFDTNTAIGFSTNHNAATGTVTIPSGLAIGTRRLIRKIHPTQGTVTIDCTGETFTRAGLSSVELNADGDYWLLEKVTTTRWELVDGWNTGENANGSWVRRASGEQICSRINWNISLSTSNFFAENTAAFPIPFISNVAAQYIVERGAGPWSAGSDRWAFVMTSAETSQTIMALGNEDRVSFQGTSGRVHYSATGRWYA